MKWLKRKIRMWLDDSDYEKPVAIREHEGVDDDPVLTFRLFNAANGQVIEFRRWDRKADRSFNTIYIIEKDRDIGEYVNKCLNLELLK